MLYIPASKFENENKLVLKKATCPECYSVIILYQPHWKLLYEAKSYIDTTHQHKIVLRSVKCDPFDLNTEIERKQLFN